MILCGTHYPHHIRKLLYILRVSQDESVKKNLGSPAFTFILMYKPTYKSRNLFQNKIIHRQFVLYTGNTLGKKLYQKKVYFSIAE